MAISYTWQDEYFAGSDRKTPPYRNLAQPIEQQASEAQSSHFDQWILYAGSPTDSVAGSLLADYLIWVSGGGSILDMLMLDSKEMN